MDSKIQDFFKEYHQVALRDSLIRLEERYGVDFSNLTRDVVLELLSETAPLNRTSRQAMLSVLIRAVNMSSEYNNRSELLKITVDDILPKGCCRRKFFANADALSFYMNLLKTYELNSEDNYYRAFVWLMYCGLIPKTGLLDLKKVNISIKNKRISINGYSYIIFDQALKHINWLINTDKICITTGTYDFSIDDYDKVIRRIPVQNARSKTVDSVYSSTLLKGVKRKMKDVGISRDMDGAQFDEESLRLSGLFYNLWLHENDSVFAENIIRRYAESEFKTKDVFYLDGKGKRYNNYQREVNRKIKTIKDAYNIWIQTYHQK